MSVRGELEQARRDGVKVGREATIRQLRTFTGIPGVIEPDLNTPEHIAYLEYEQALIRLVDERREGVRTWEENATDSTEQLDLARRRATEAVESRRAARDDANPLVRTAGAIADRFLSTRRDAAAAERERDAVYGMLHRAEDGLVILQQELHRVSAWLDALFTAVDEGRRTREVAASAARAEFEAAWRDVTSRRFVVTTVEEFLNADGRRLFDDDLIPMIGGVELGTRWRRDEDERIGHWRFHWIEATGEAVVEHPLTETVWILGGAVRSEEQAVEVFGSLEARQGERNSLGLVLDAYEAVAAGSRVGGGR